MDENFHGYYIHGKAPAGKADLILSELIKSLDAEQVGAQRPRGINTQLSMNVVQGQSIQGYEIYFPQKVRQEYDQIYA